MNGGLPIAMFDCQIVMMFVLPWQAIPIIVGFISYVYILYPKNVTFYPIRGHLPWSQYLLLPCNSISWLNWRIFSHVKIPCLLAHVDYPKNLPWRIYCYCVLCLYIPVYPVIICHTTIPVVSSIGLTYILPGLKFQDCCLYNYPKTLAYPSSYPIKKDQSYPIHMENLLLSQYPLFMFIHHHQIPWKHHKINLPKGSVLGFPLSSLKSNGLSWLSLFGSLFQLPSHCVYIYISQLPLVVIYLYQPKSWISMYI